MQMTLDSCISKFLYVRGSVNLVCHMYMKKFHYGLLGRECWIYFLVMHMKVSRALLNQRNDGKYEKVLDRQSNIF